MNTKKYKRDAKQTIDQLFDKIEALEKRKDSISDKLSEDFSQKLSALKDAKLDLLTKYEELESAADKKWDASKNSFNQATAYFEKGLKEIASLV